jgi:hypothetical protein
LSASLRMRSRTRSTIGVVFMAFFVSNFFFNPREISVGAFSGVENAKMWGSSPEMPKTGSPLAKGGLVPKIRKR